MSAPASAIYLGRVMHQRLRPRRHKFEYRGFWFVFDIDEIDALAGRLKTFSRNRFNLFSFYDRDYGDRSGEPPRAHVERHMTEAGLTPDGGRIELLTLPRILGFVFNPLSTYFIHGADGRLRAILWEVSNTFGERHSYLIRFRVAPPKARMTVSITGSDREGVMIVAAMNGERRALGDRALFAAFASVPFMTLKVVAAIHWEALRLWIKGARFRSSPPPPAAPVSFVPREAP